MDEWRGDPVSRDLIIKGVVGLAVVGVGGFLLWKAVGLGKGLLTGDNALTKNATDAQGNKVTAYVGVPVLGTLGAAANEVSGGWLSSLGGWIGRSTYDLTHSEPDPTAAVPAYYDETDRLLKRYPDVSGATNGASVYSGWSDQPGIY